MPGVTAGLACAAELNVILTKRNVSRSICFVTPAFSDKSNVSWLRSVLNSDTAVIYMGGKDLEKIASSLIDSKMSVDMPVAIIENASTRPVKTLTKLSCLITYHLKTDGPVCLIIGNIFSFTNTMLTEDVVIKDDNLKEEKISYVA